MKLKINIFYRNALSIAQIQKNLEIFQLLISHQNIDPNVIYQIF